MLLRQSGGTHARDAHCLRFDACRYVARSTVRVAREQPITIPNVHVAVLIEESAISLRTACEQHSRSACNVNASISGVPRRFEIRKAVLNTEVVSRRRLVVDAVHYTSRVPAERTLRRDIRSAAA